MKIGCHVNNGGNLMLLGSAEQALNYDANCFMVYLGAPQSTIRRPINEMKILEMRNFLKVYNINLEDVIVHAPYIVNLAQSDYEKRKFAVDFLTHELRIMDHVGVKYMVLHPGAHVGIGYEEGIKKIALGINEMLSITSDSKTVIALETMAGKGTECGSVFEQIAQIIDLVEDKTRIAVCLDTCHIHDAGYDIVNDYEGVINEFDRIIGLKYLKVIHINDSKNIRGAHKDRHENIGFGYIGFDTIKKFCYDERFKDIPKILETPYVPDPIKSVVAYAPYKCEIAMIKKGVFDPNLKENAMINHW